MEEDIRRLEEDLRRKMQDLKVAHTRLETRTYRPNMELCRDQVPTSPGAPRQEPTGMGPPVGLENGAALQGPLQRGWAVDPTVT